MGFQPGNNLGRGPYHHKRPRIITQRLIAELNATDENDIPKLHRFANALLDKALEGDVTAIKEVLDRVEGKVPQPIAGDPENPLVIASVIREIVDPTQRTNPPLTPPDVSYSRAS